MACSPDGQRLAVARYGHSELEVVDFDPQTGRVANPRAFFLQGGTYGVAFSPSGRMLYASGGMLRQIDLLTGQLTTVMGTGLHSAASLLPGPDNRLYVRCSGTRQPHLDVVDFPDLPAPQCGYRLAGVPLGARAGNIYTLGLPNNVVVTRPAPGALPVGIAVAGACLGQAATLSALPTPVRPDLRWQWDFGDPDSGQPAATGPSVQHVFSRSGTYLVTLRAFEPGSTTPLSQASLPVTVLAPPPAPLLPRTLILCPNQAQNIGVTWEPQTQYRWQNGSDAPAHYIGGPGLYWVEANTNGCIRRDTMQVVSLSEADFTLGADTTLCPTSYLTLRVRPRLPGMQYRWSDGSTRPERTVTGPGDYTVAVAPAEGGCWLTLRRRVGAAAECLVQLPTIITPNGDGQNDALVLVGLVAADYDIEIYNRWGQRVYAREGYDNGWQAKGLSAGNYYFLLRHHLTPFRYRGWVEVVR